MLLLYPLSLGPASVLVSRGHLPVQAFEAIYFPFIASDGDFRPAWARDALVDYSCLCHRVTRTDME